MCHARHLSYLNLILLIKRITCSCETRTEIRRAQNHQAAPSLAPHPLFCPWAAVEQSPAQFLLSRPFVPSSYWKSLFTAGCLFPRSWEKRIFLVHQTGGECSDSCHPINLNCLFLALAGESCLKSNTSSCCCLGGGSSVVVMLKILFLGWIMWIIGE